MLSPEIQAEVNKALHKMRSKGGRNSVKKRLKGKTPEQVSAIMRAAANARWAKKKTQESAA